MDEIIRIGREHLVSVGAGNLSLRAIARELGVVSSAVYRYVPSRDDLLTELIVDAYDALGDRVEHAHQAVPAADLVGRLVAIGLAMREWALSEPTRYALLYGDPVRGYRAPAARTDQPALRVAAYVAQVFADVEVLPGVEAAVGVHHRRDEDMGMLRTGMGIDLSDVGAESSLLVWSSLLGWISAEVFGQFAGLLHPEVVFERQIRRLASLLIAGVTA